MFSIRRTAVNSALTANRLIFKPRRVCQSEPMRPRAVDRVNPPPGPFRDDFWRSPLRGPWLTAVLGLVLLVGLPVVIVTGLLSNDAYQPGLGANGFGRNVGGPLDLYLFGWPTRPPWLYALTQGLHVAVGLALFPVLLAKLWSVIPRLFEWPPARSPAHALERLSLALLVGGALFEFVTGILNIQYWYAFQAFFVTAHYYGAWVFIAAFLRTRDTQVRDDAPVTEDPRPELLERSRGRPVSGPDAERSLARRVPGSPRARRAGRCSARSPRGLSCSGCRVPPNRWAGHFAAWRSCSHADACDRGRSASRSTRQRSPPEFEPRRSGPTGA